MVLTVTLNPALDREIFIEDFQVNRLYRIRDLSKTQMSPGGKGINVSIALSRLGCRQSPPDSWVGTWGRFLWRN